MAASFDRSREASEGAGVGSGTPLETRLSVEEGGAVLTVGGEVDADTAEQCRRALLDAQTFTIRGGVTFMDSAGLNAPVRAYHRVPNGGQLRVVGLRPNARRAVEITGLTGLFQDDVPDAPTEA